MVMMGTGLLIGLIAALALSSVMRTLVYGISIRDPFTFALAPFVLCGTAFIACLEPAWRAVRIDPLRALRTE
jgi:ABC-type antimicrobial peptide transport system permease subunit